MKALLSPRSFVLGVVLAACVFTVATPAVAQQVVLSEEAYLMPPKEIADFLLSDRFTNVSLRSLSPSGKLFLITNSGGMPPLSKYAKPYVNLGETPIDHMANRSRRLTTGNSIGFETFDHESGKRVTIDVPEGASVSNASWSPDGSKIAYLANFDDGSHIFVADAMSGQSTKITETPLLASLVTAVQWTQDGKQILTVLLPDDRAAMPQPNGIATEPMVRMTLDGRTPGRTLRFLLKSPYDMALLEYFSTGQLALIDVGDRKVTKIGQPAMFTSVNAAPDGKYFRVTMMRKPFSYIVARSSFGSLEELWDIDGNKVYEVNKRELRDGSQNRQTRSQQRGRRGGRGGRGRGGTTADGKRSLTWRVDGNGMSFLQQEPRPKKEEGADDEAEQEEGDEDEEEPKRKDRVMHWLPPYEKDSAQVIWESETRISSVRYSQDCHTLFITQNEDGKSHLFAVELDSPDVKHTILKTEGNDFYENPGNLMTKRGSKGGSVVQISSDGNFVYFRGTKNFKDNEENAPRPFIDKIAIKSDKEGEAAEKTRIFESEADVYENVAATPDDDMRFIFTTRESPKMISDTYKRDLESGDLKKLTENKDYAPKVTAAKRMRFKVKRVDGFEFLVKVTMPADYGLKLPAMFWFYPREYTDQESYDNRSRNYNKNRFPTVGNRTMTLLTLLGYAVVEPDSPIVGEQGRMNDNYVHDLRNNLWAVIDELDKRQLIDRDRLAVGGHSYGAFSTGNALAHTPFFKAGIAGDGNYNRTLTPMSFQSERRFFWDARETYISMSPLLWANQINGALLMYHGMDDNNSGTFPINSPRMFQVLNGLDKPAALYMYPYEGHGPATKETICDLWARWTEWLDIYVKHPERAEELKKPQKKRDSSEGGR